MGAGTTGWVHITSSSLKPDSSASAVPWLTRAQPRQEALHPFRQGVVGRVLVGEHGVAADRGERAGHQDREFRRPPGVAEVRVPELRQGSGS